ncbi:hypothetical protein VTH06DRAFT_1641 [Thermothelomyces fergusii]
MEGGVSKRNGPRSRIPEGVDLSLPSLNGPPPEDATPPEASVAASARYHWPSRRKGPGSVASSVSMASAASSAARSQRGYHREHGRSLDEYIHSLDAAQSRHKARGSSRDGRHARDASLSRDGGRDKSLDRGRAAARNYTPKGGKRSPKSPVPMSPEDLINLATPSEDQGRTRQGGSGNGPIHASDDEREREREREPEPSSQPSTVRKVGYANRDGSQARAPSRAASRNGRGSSRARSPGKRHAPPALELRGRSASRGPPAKRSPSSPQPMSVSNLQRYYTSDDDEEDYRRALEDQERFRQRNNRSASGARRGEGITSPVSARSNAWSAREPGRERLESRRTAAHAGPESSSQQNKAGVQTQAQAQTQTPAPAQLVTDSSGDLKVIKDERQLKKEAAARELEARRKSLARRPSAPPILHPSELTPASGTNNGASNNKPPPTLMELPSTTYVPPKKEDLPSRSASVDVNAGRSMFANRNGPAIGLPATPRAMRLVMESEASRNKIPVPPMPGQSSQSESQSRRSPGAAEKERKDEDIPLLLPATVYTPPPAANSRAAAQIGRSMSAPPADLVQPHGHSRRPSAMKPTPAGRRPSHDANMAPPPPPPPPPPQPAPPVLKELQHLAQPPPPPPPPLPHASGPKPVIYGGSSGLIEIVMDDDDQPEQQPPQQQHQQQQQHQDQHQQPPPPPPPAIPAATPVSESTVPIISPPNPRQTHSRGRSSADNSIGARITRATERMRSASRSRAASVKSPPAEMMTAVGTAPYESVQMPPPPSSATSSHPPVSMLNSYRAQNQVVYQQVQAQVAQQEGRNEFRTGLHQSEMI